MKSATVIYTVELTEILKDLTDEQVEALVRRSPEELRDLGRELAGQLNMDDGQILRHQVQVHDEEGGAAE